MNEISQYDKDTLAYLEAVGVKDALLERVRQLVEEVTAGRTEWPSEGELTLDAMQAEGDR